MYKKKGLLTCFGMIALLSSTIALAGNREGAFSFGLEDGYVFFANKRGLENTSTPTIQLGYEFNEKWGIQAGVTVINTNIENQISGSGAHGFYYLLDGIYHIATYGNWVPYALGGVGVTSLKVNNNNDPRNEGNINAGIGTQYFIDNSIALNVDARDVYTMSGGKNDVMLLAGVTLFFGGQSPEPEKPVFKGETTKST